LNTYEDPDERATLTKDTTTNQSHATSSDKETSDNEEDYFLTPNAPRLPQLSGSASSPKGQLPPHVTAPAHSKLSPPKRRGHNRNLSTNTILYNPVSELGSSPSPPKSRPLTAKNQSQANTGTHTPTAAASGHRTPRHSIYNPVKEGKTKPRPILPSRQQFQSIPNFNIDERVMGTGRPRPVIRHRRSSLDMGMSELGLESNAPGMQLGAVPSSFATQLAMATGAFGGRTGANAEGESEKMMGRLMLARMKTLEEGFAEVVKEFRGLRTAGNSSVENDLPARDKGKGKERDRRSKKKGMVRTTSEIDFAKMGKGKGKENEDADIPEGELPSRYKSKGSSL
jgi:hypothetical protein